MKWKQIDSDRFIEFLNELGVKGPYYIEAKYDMERKMVGPNGHGKIWISQGESELSESVVAAHMDTLGLSEYFDSVPFVEAVYTPE